MKSSDELVEVQVRFIGRKRGAIGITYEIEHTLKVPKNIKYGGFRLKLYDEGFEHITLDKRDVFIKGTNDRLFLDLESDLRFH